MMRLFRAELRRLFSRRLVVLVMAGGILVSGLLLLSAWQMSQPMSAAERENAQTQYEIQLADWEENGEEWLAQCLEDEARESELQGEEVDFGCEQMEPQEEWFFYVAPPLEDTLPGALAGQAYLLAVLALLVGATFTAAEFATGSISSWLTFEPRRLRVYLTKVLASGVGVVPVVVLSLAILVSGAWAVARAFGLAGGMSAADWSDAATMTLRILVLGVVAALVGAALGVLLRHTAAVLGVVVGYVVVVELIIANRFMQLKPWLVGTNVDGWINDGTVYYVNECTTDATGTMCEFTEQTLTFGHSAAYLAALAGIVLVAGALVFRRRDAV